MLRRRASHPKSTPSPTGPLRPQIPARLPAEEDGGSNRGPGLLSQRRLRELDSPQVHQHRSHDTAAEGDVLAVQDTSVQNVQYAMARTGQMQDRRGDAEDNRHGA
jgi:hypothetical protein